MRNISIGILQFGSLADKEKTLEKIDLLLKPKEADIIVMPEYTMGNPLDMTPDEFSKYAEDIQGVFSKKILRYSVEYGIPIIAGIFEKTGGNIYNTAVKYSPDEDIEYMYRKIHLFDAYGYRETEYFKAGDKPSKIFDVKNVKFGIAICFDIRFPELFRYYSLNDVEVILLPSGWIRGPMKEESLRFLARARSHENVLYMVLAVQYGKDYTGRSMVVDPLGTVVHELGIGEKYSEYSIDADDIYKVREFLPLLRLRRSDLYKKWGL